MPVQGQDLVIKNITKFGKGFFSHVNKTMSKVEKILDKQVTKNISLTDHSLKDLAKLSWPYAQWHGSRGMHLHDPWWQVHKHSGRLLSSKISGIHEASFSGGKLNAKAYVMLDGYNAEHAIYVIYGTSKMIPRPALKMSLEQVRGKIFSVIEKNLKDGVTNFKAG